MKHKSGVTSQLLVNGLLKVGVNQCCCMQLEHKTEIIAGCGGMYLHEGEEVA